MSHAWKALTIRPFRRRFLETSFESTVLALYPTLIGFADANTAASTPLGLSRENVVTSGSKWFLVDMHSHLLVYASVPGTPLPADLDSDAKPASELHKEVHARRDSLTRRRRPAVKVCAAGQANASHFESALLDDRALPDGSGEGYRSFVRQVADQVSAELNRQ